MHCIGSLRRKPARSMPLFDLVPIYLCSNSVFNRRQRMRNRQRLGLRSGLYNNLRFSLFQPHWRPSHLGKCPAQAYQNHYYPPSLLPTKSPLTKTRRTAAYLAHAPSTSARRAWAISTMPQQKTSASPALRRLALKHAMPASMWRHRIHSFLELPSLEYMLTFIYIAYSIMALLYKTRPAYKDTWIELLDDIGRYRFVPALFWLNSACTNNIVEQDYHAKQRKTRINLTI
jgi:hypothetical protein